MNPTWLDHLFVAFLVLILPVWAVADHRRLVARMKAGVPGARITAYAKILLLEWAMVVVILLLWLSRDRPFRDLGLAIDPGLRWWIGALLVAGAAVFLFLQLLQVKRSPRAREQLRGQLAPLREIIPESAAESRWFTLLSITAGICEEITYRGFLFAYAASFLGMLGGIGVSSAVFGLGHAYQGPAGILKTAGLGLVMAGLFVLTGSLVAPILLHAVIDITSGRMGRIALAEDPEASPPAAGGLPEGNV